MEPKTLAAELFHCAPKFVGAFEREDPFNNILVSGFICRKKGLSGGSLLITKVDGKEVSPEIIHGVPKLAYPYKINTKEWLPFKGAGYCLTNKWNGMNVLWYFYAGSDGKPLLTAKSKGAPFLNNSEFGNYLDLAKRAMENLEVSAKIYSALGGKNVRAVSAELCGTAEKHLVKYDFELDLKPLFTIHDKGRIKPVVSPTEITWNVDGAYLANLCEQAQDEDELLNLEFQKKHGLKASYEYERFATEGRVLSILDTDGFVQGRTMFKIKPLGIATVHQSRFDEGWEGRVREALAKMKTRESDFTVADFQDELEVGPKEWSRFGADCLKFAEQLGFVLTG